MKLLVTVFLALVPSLSFASLADRAYDIAERIAQREHTLNKKERQLLGQSLGFIEGLLWGNGGGSSDNKAMCISNGEFASFEKFAPYIGGKVQGKYTAKATCEQLVRSINSNLMCISNGEFASFEKFAVNDLKSGVRGGYTSLETCQRLVQSANRSYVCISNGEFASFEKFALYDRKNNSTVGGWTSLQNCLNY